MDDADDAAEDECYKDPESGRRRRKLDDDENFEGKNRSCLAF